MNNTCNVEYSQFDRHVRYSQISRMLIVQWTHPKARVVNSRHICLWREDRWNLIIVGIGYIFQYKHVCYNNNVICCRFYHTVDIKSHKATK